MAWIHPVLSPCPNFRLKDTEVKCNGQKVLEQISCVVLRVGVGIKAACLSRFKRESARREEALLEEED